MTIRDINLSSYLYCTVYLHIYILKVISTSYKNILIYIFAIVTYCFLYPLVYNLSHAHNVHTVFLKERVGSGVSGAQSGSGSIGEGFNVYVVFVHGEEEVLGAVLGADGEAARKVGEVSVAAEIRRLSDGASE